MPSPEPSRIPSASPTSIPPVIPTLVLSPAPSTPTAPTAPTPIPTLVSVPTSPSPIQLSIVQSLSAISEASFDNSAQSVFKTAVAQVLSAYRVKSSDVTITSYSNDRRVLTLEYQSRSLSGAMQNSYTVNFVAQSAGYTSSSTAFAAAKSTLTAAVQSSTFNNALISAAVILGNIPMQSVTSSSTISITNTTPSGSASKTSIDERTAVDLWCFDLGISGIIHL